MLQTALLLLATTLSAGESPALRVATNRPPAVKQCRPDVWSVLLSAAWAYATKSPASVFNLRPCADDAQEALQEPLKQEAPPPPRRPSRLTELPAAEALREARWLFIHPRSHWFSREKLERELIKRKEFGEMGLELTRNIDHAELVLEITRKKFTSRFTCAIIEPTTERVLAAVTSSSLGSEIEPRLAEAIVKQFKAARDKPTNGEEKPD